MRRILVAVAALGASVPLGHAATFATSGMPTGTNTSGACYFRNVGTRLIRLHVDPLLNFSPGFITLDFQNCNDAPLAGGRTCLVLVNDLPDDVAFSCSAEVSGNTRNLRGSAEVRFITASGPFVAASEEAR